MPRLCRGAKVLVEVAGRRHMIRKALDAATRTVAGARWREDEALVETVVHLTEWPSVILGNFEPEYLDLPEEVLVTVMRDHQKYFAVEDATASSRRISWPCSTPKSIDEGRAIIRHGNERVLRARFKDARFFWDFDQKTPLVDRVESLKAVTFQKELGSYYWKTEQNERVVRGLVETLKQADVAVNEAELYTAVLVAKTDLTTELVKEFTELQGQIGGLYACTQGLGQTVRRPSTTSTRRLQWKTTSRGRLKGNYSVSPIASRRSPPCSVSAMRRRGRRTPLRCAGRLMRS